MQSERSLHIAGYTVGALLILGGALGVWLNRGPAPAVFAEYTSESSGLQFAYPVGASGYSVTVSQGGDKQANLLETIVLSHESDTALPEYGEGPPTITIAIFKNDQKQFPLAWANAHASYSNITLAMSDIEQAVIGGANAIRYRADGLYASDTVVVAHGGFIYVFSGAYIDESSPTKRDFDPLLGSVRFISTGDEAI